MKLVKILALFSLFQVSANHLICLQNNSSTAHTGLPSVVAYLNTLRNNYIPDISQVWLPKNQIPGYQLQFNLELVSMEQAPSAIRQILGTSYETDPKYFAKKFQNLFPEKVFHSIGNYRYKGFREYVKKIPGFEEFILTAGDQLKIGSDLYKKLLKSGNLQDFTALKNMHQEKVQELEQKAQQTDMRNNLVSKDFNEHGIKLLEQHGIASQFLYHGNSNQIAQLKQITGFMNDAGEFKHEYCKIPELNEIAGNAVNFGILANNANRENLLSMSQFCLEIGQNLLALGRGLVAGCGRNTHAIYQMVRHPINTSIEIGSLLKNIGVGIGNVAKMLAKNEVGQRLNDQALIDSAQQDMNRYVDSSRQIYQYAKKTWQDKSKIERYELAGSLATDLLLAKGLPAAAKLAPINNLAQYAPQAFANLGELGREINQIAGLTCAKGAKAVQNGFEVIKNYPKIIQAQQSLGEAVWYGNKCLNASNKYLQQLSKHALKSAIDTERRLIKIGDYVKKIPKACIAKTKQFLGEEVLVTDALGNVWRSKMGDSDWVTEFSEQGKRALTLLNEAAGGLKGAAHEAFQPYRTVPYGIQAREALNLMKWQFKALEQEMRAAGKTFKDLYGPHVAGKLGDDLIHFKGKDHLLAATIKRNIKASGISEKLTGLHWDYGRKLEQLGIYSLSDVEYFAGGMYRATLNYGEVIKKGKTFFPSNWDAKMLASKISEACYNVTKIDHKWDGALEIVGIIEEGFQITIRLDKKGRILTAFPDLIKKV